MCNGQRPKHTHTHTHPLTARCTLCVCDGPYVCLLCQIKQPKQYWDSTAVARCVSVSPTSIRDSSSDIKLMSPSVEGRLFKGPHGFTVSVDLLHLNSEEVQLLFLLLLIFGSDLSPKLIKGKV
ncbi:hypothetical protein ILYODFUR_012222 [Ilyodon furcidens]|uniref:B box-type domain-containing protein n=1 Tax=Ilyodon furcidens TaxID=33524 RepID=A0ABV0U8N8_9TELE